MRVLESLTDGFAELDADWNFAYVNAAFERMNGVRRDDLLGRNHWTVYPETVGSDLEANYRRVRATGTPCAFENYFPPWDRWFAVNAFPADGGGVCVQVREVTDAKRAERRLQFLDGLNQATRAATDTGPVLRTTTRLLGQHLAATRCAYADVDVDANRFTIRDDWAVPGAASTVGVLFARPVRPAGGGRHAGRPHPSGAGRGRRTRPGRGGGHV